jgi:transposase-like protein
MASLRRKFSRAFKLDALKRLEAGDSVREVSGSCRIDANVLRRWRRDYERAQEFAFPGPGRRPRETGIAELRRQIELYAEQINHLTFRIQSAEARRTRQDATDANGFFREQHG